MTSQLPTDLATVAIDDGQIDRLTDEVLQDLYSLLCSLLQDLPLFLQTITDTHTHTRGIISNVYTVFIKQAVAC